MSANLVQRRLFVLPVMLLAMASFLLAIWAGWIRSGWPFTDPGVAGHHGALMVGGFLGTLIAAERAVTLPRVWLLAPFINGLSLPLFFAGQTDTAIACLLAGGLGLTSIYVKISIKNTHWYIYLLLAGALMYLAGNLLLLRSHFYPAVFPWWMAFFLFTIVGERMELTQYLPVKNIQRILLLCLLILFIVGSLLPYHTWGRFAMAAALAGTGLWLIKWDMARKAIRRKGIHRYSGSNLLLGYGWLLVTAILMIYGSLGMLYDAVLHAFFIGFVMAMIFAHAPIILPGILKFTFQPYHPVLWTWVVLLHLSLILRMAGDLLIDPELRQWGGFANGIVIMGFMATMATLTVRKGRNRVLRTSDQ